MGWDGVHLAVSLSLWSVCWSHEVRHGKVHRRASPQSGPVSPCGVAGIESEDFVRQCTGYYEKGFVCLRSPTSLVAKSTIAMLEDHIKGQMAYCYYDTIRRRVESRPIGDEILIAAERRRQAKKEEEARRKKESGIQGHPPGTKERPPKLSDLLRPMHRRFRVSITVMDRYKSPGEFRPRDLQWLKAASSSLAAECRTQETAGLRAARNASAWTQELRRVFAGETRALWSFGDCETDLAILVLGTPAGGENRERPSLSVSLSSRAEGIMGPEVRSLTEAVNGDGELVTAGAMLRAFFTRLMPLYTELFEAFPERKLHRIPNWAVWAFGVSGALSVGAVVLGNVVTSDRKRSAASAASGAKKAGGGRQWGAGFSGGMWKS